VLRRICSDQDRNNLVRRVIQTEGTGA
jgi:hypothetical protein